MLIAMAGLPGAGKSTIAARLGEHLHTPVVSVDPIESSILRAGIDSDQPTGLAAYLVAETLAATVIQAGSGIIVDAVNAVDPAREQWVNLAARSGVPVKFIEVICSDAGLHRSRIEARERTLPHLAATSWHAVEQSQDEYAQWSGPSAEIERLTLDSVDRIDLNLERAIAFLAQ